MMSRSDILPYCNETRRKRTKSVACHVTYDGCGFRVSVDIVNKLAIALFHRPASHFHAVSKQAVLRSEFIGEKNGSFQFFETGQALIDLLDDGVIKSLYFRVLDKLSARGKGNLVVAGPVFQQGKIWGDEYGWELALIPNNDGFGDKGVVLQRILDRLGRDKFPA